MTTDEIKEFIDKRENEIKKDYETRNDFYNYDRLMHYISLVANIKSMLDELEQENKDIKAKPIFLKSDNEMIPRCPRCNHALLLKQDEHKCSKCGKEIDWS